MHVIYHHRTQGRDVEAVHIRGLAGGLEQLGYAVEVVGPPGVRTDADALDSPTNGTNQTLLGRMARALPQWAFELAEIGYNAVALPRLLARSRAQRPAFIYERYALYNAAGVLAGKLLGVPVVLEINDTADMDRTRQGKQLAMRPLARAFENAIFRGASGLVPVSGYLRDHLVSRGLPAGRISVTPNAVDAAWFDPERFTGQSVRQRHRLEDAVVIGFTGSFTKWHGLDLLVGAFALVARDVPRLRLLLVGDGPKRPEAEARVRELGLEARVVFTGRVPHAEIPEHVAAMDIGVMPQSNPFGSPMKVFEYQAMARPVVAPRFQPLEEAMEPDVTGLLFEPGGEAGLAAALRALAEDPDRRRAMGEAGRRKVLAQHLWVHNAAAVQGLVPATRVSALHRQEA
jgi:glycosyltransferase involved in cell wall biosynthesis